MKTIINRKKTEAIIFFSLGIVCFAVHGRWLSHIGIGAEQYWILQSLHKSLFGGFVYGDDQSRLFMSSLFHLAYIFFGTSYQAILILNVLLTLITSFLVYLVLRTLSFDTYYGVIAALLVVLSGGDTSTRLFSMLVVKQIVICALVLILISLLIINKNRITLLQKIIVLIASTIGSYTYEVFIGFLFVLLTYLFIVFRDKNIKSYIFYASLPGGLALYQIVSRYIFEDRTSYQSQKFVIPDGQRIFESSLTYLGGSLAPWTWDKNGFRQVFAQCELLIDKTIGNVPILLSIVLTLTVAYFLIFKQINKTTLKMLKNDYRYIFLFASLIAGSYIPYFFVSDGNSNWRTQLLGQPLVIILLMFLIRFSVSYSQSFRYLIGMCFSSYFFIWSFFGITSLQTDNLYFAKYWADHSVFFNSVVSFVPSFMPNTQILVVDVPSENSYCPGAPRDPFEDKYWFQAGLHSYYPESYDPKSSKLVGTYTHKSLDETYKDISLINGQTALKLGDNQGFIPTSNLLLLEFHEGKAKVIGSLIDRDGAAVSDYRPQILISRSSFRPQNTNLNIPILEIFR